MSGGRLSTSPSRGVSGEEREGVHVRRRPGSTYGLARELAGGGDQPPIALHRVPKVAARIPHCVALLLMEARLMEERLMEERRLRAQGKSSVSSPYRRVPGITDHPGEVEPKNGRTSM